MRTEIKLSTRFLTTTNAHQVGLLTTLTGDVPANRAPINVALVLDRSGSMSGMPLAAAKEAAARFAAFLGAKDRLSVVAFDEEVRVIHGPAPAGNPSAAEAIARLQPGGSTNLSGGWLKGAHLVQSGMVDGVNRIVLLTDGQANAGIVDPEALLGLARGGAAERFSTTCIGFGASFNEDLLQSMARGGGGNYWYVERHDQMGNIFAGEIEGLVALAAQNVEVEVRLTHSRAGGVTFPQGYPVRKTPEGTWRITLGDLYATMPLALGMIVHVEDVTELGQVQVAEVRVEADVIRPDGVEHRTIIMPVVANLDGTDHPEPIVEQTFLRFAAAQARDEAIRRADGGDLGGAAQVLRDAAAQLAPCSADPALAEEMEDLTSAAMEFEARNYAPADRKYHAARAMAAREMKEEYARRMSRRRPQA